ncbi:MAG: phenylalanine--tRNA ligase subunit alpha [Chloroflexi bacterium]|nr:phenylalanine--tRNA ligase subunit alpha [Chloroflexota bacterium]
MRDPVGELRAEALQALSGAGSPKGLESWRVKYLGRNSELTRVLRGLGTLPLEARKTVGSRANQLRVELEDLLKEKEQALRQTGIAVTGAESVDITLPGRPLPSGRLHPITQTIYEMCDIFASLGFQVVEGAEVEWDYYNFEALNIPKEHPARDSMSTYWLDTPPSDREWMALLRTHTTSVTARIVETMKPPIRTIEPGRVFRYEASDATHVPMFHQVDAVAVDKGITMADLKGTLYEFARRFFGPDRRVRFRCDFFPFVEPGVEMAIECAVCHGEGCRLCGNSGWIEILGAGMTHPRVLERGGIDPAEYTSFAFGIGIDRLPMLRYGIDDVRLFYGSDLRFLRQF